MAELYERIAQLCKSEGVTVTEMCKKSGASRGSLTDLKKGRISSLSLETLSKIANFFKIDMWTLVEYQTVNQETKKSPSEDGEIDELLEELRREEVRTLLEATRGMSRGEVEAMADFAKKLKGGN